MFWLTWRQHRKETLFVIAALAVLAVLLIPSGRQMHSAFTGTGLADCLRGLDRSVLVPLNPDTGKTDCGPLLAQFNSRFGGRAPLGILFFFVPLLVGLFFGAPLVSREIEHGTHRLVWTQGVSRLRWTAVKFGLVIAGAVVFAAAYTVLLTWWMTPLNMVGGSRLSLLVFDQQGIVPIAYTLFAVALGALAGTFTRRVLPTMAVTVAGFLVVRLLIAWRARPQYLAPERRTYPYAVGESAPNDLLAGDWVLSQGFHDADGSLLQSGTVLCSGPADACTEFGAGAYNLELYQPAERFWTFQYIEAGLFTALAVALLALAVHRIRRLA